MKSKYIYDKNDNLQKIIISEGDEEIFGYKAIIAGCLIGIILAFITITLFLIL